ncbi:DeoR/GlpR family DNA-binding transcription regulator [Nakamurella leprariae]|uniref:DeoR/GlpR transcriptional regulator n=1 Tax=Nakamurella leprariae TaxID=2803911 RepID=A0A939C0Q7_9ACTN|nr:DeoR/GlpR family DNA-binding transcription regulator [Nakamurella leprariae]MBM9469031.1 DeoR/GlpR transcriptional regulator [Nakamurella leprariae]
MDRQERWSKVLELLAASELLTVEAAAAALEVSPATIRRDFEELADRQMLVRTRGGAKANGMAYDLPLRYKSGRNAEEKRRIGAAAAELIPDRSIVGFTGGTTTTEVARALAARPDRPTDRTAPWITVVTNAMNIASEMILRPAVKVVLTGGVARPQSYELVGSLAEPALRELSLDLAVIGVNAVSADRGASTENEEEASINRLLAQRADAVIVVADSTKIGRRAFAQVCPASTINTLVTDTGADPAQVAALTTAGIRVIQV